MATCKRPADARSEIADLLAEAIELEHSLSLQYQFAAFGIKTHITEGGINHAQLLKMQRWKGILLNAARQEMEHLGLACNIQSAIGEAPMLYRRNFPVPQDYLPIDIGLTLERFGLPMLKRAILYEMPTDLNECTKARLKKIGLDYEPYQRHTIAKHYESIRRKIEAAGDGIFVGPPDAQIGNIQVFPTQIIGVPVANIAARAYYSVLVRPVYNAQHALDAIDQIIAEGEGYPAQGNYRGSHFLAFLELYEALSDELGKDPGFAPSRPVVDNPRATTADPKHDAHMALTAQQPTELENPLADKLATFFDRGYQATVSMLMRFYFHQGRNEREIETLARIAFFPMMTGFIRPIGELLTRLPAGSASGPPFRNAGPGFAFAPRLSVISDAAAAWKVIRDEVQALRVGIEALARSGDPGLDAFAKARLDLTWQNLARIAMYFNQLIDPPKLPSPDRAQPVPPPQTAPPPPPLLVLQYGGWVSIRLPTDPDPTDEPRGASGTTFAYGDEPDLNREIAFDAPAGLRSLAPKIGVFVRCAERIDKDGAHTIAALQGARFELLDHPKLENRNWTLTPPGCEPIVPFHMRISSDSGIVLEAEDILGLRKDGVPPPPLWEIPATELARRGPPGMALEPATAASITGQWDSKRVAYERRAALERELEDLGEGGAPGKLAVLRGRLQALDSSLNNPADRRIGMRGIIERWGFMFNQPGSVSGDKGALGGTLNPNAWSISFWMGGWDADLLVAYMYGSLTMTYSE
jgi:hypothetical protein